MQNQFTNADVKELPFLLCPKCGGDTFIDLHAIKFLSALHPKNQIGQDQTVIVNAGKQCINCQFLAVNYKDLKKEEITKEETKEEDSKTEETKETTNVIPFKKED